MLISRSSACCSLLLRSTVLIPPVLMQEILVKFSGFLSIGPPMLPAMLELVSMETLVSVIIVGRADLDHRDNLETAHNPVAFHSLHSL